MKSCQNNIAVMGYLCLDLFLDLKDNHDLSFVPGMLQEVGACSAFPGGVVGNTGLALHQLGVPAKLLGKVGNDVFGNSIKDFFARHSPDYIEHLNIEDCGNTGYCVVLSPPGRDRMFLAHRGINDKLVSEDADDNFLDDTAILHFGYPPICKSFAEDNGYELQKLFRRAREKTIISSLDMSLPSPGSFSCDLDWKTFLRASLPLTDIFLPSIDELVFMLEPRIVTKAQMLRAMAEQLLDFGTGIIGIKLGADGLYVRTSGNSERLKFLEPVAKGTMDSWLDREFIVPSREVEVVGATGAGDAAIAGFLAGVAGGFSAEGTALLAVATGACNVTAHDAISGIKPQREIQKKLREGWKAGSLSFAAENIQIIR